MSHLIGHIATVTKMTKSKGVDRIESMLTGTVLSEQVNFDADGNVVSQTIVMSSLSALTGGTAFGNRLTIDVEDD